MMTRATARERITSRLASEEARRLALLAIAAIAIRLLAMPFTLHFDAYQIYSRAHEAAYHNEWFGFTSQIIIQSVHNLWLLVIRPFLPDSEPIWSHSASVIGIGASREDYERFLAYDHLYRAIFLMKLPYVLADLGCAWTLTRLVAPARRFAVAAFWLLNPLVIFSTAIYGRHDGLAILLVLLSIIAARRATDVWRLAGLGLLGVATLARFFPIVLVPLYLLAFRRSARQLALFAGLLVGMVAAVELASLASSGRSAILTILNSYEHFQYWFDAGLYLRFDDYILLFPLAYILGLLWASERGVAPDEYPRFAAAAFLLLFSVTFFHPHYAVWLAPFLALTIPGLPGARRMIAYHAIQIVCVLLYSAQWGAWTTWDLIEPLAGERVGSLPDPVEAIDAQIAPRIFFGVFRSALTAVSLWMAWRLLRGNLVPPASPPPEERGTSRPEERAVASARAKDKRSASVIRLSFSRHSRHLGFLLPLLLIGCSARVTGFESPVAHDYAAVAWMPLDRVVEQTFVAGPGYADAVANDPRTTPTQFQERLAALPQDARTGELVDLRVGLRRAGQADQDNSPWETGARLQLVHDPARVLVGKPPDAPAAPLLDMRVDALPRDGDWLRVPDPPDVPSGAVVALRLIPGSGPNAEALQFGLTPDRYPYGAWRATDADGKELPGALLARTVYERDVDLRALAASAWSRLADAASGDTPFALIWSLGMAALLIAGLGLARRPNPAAGEG